MMSDTPKAGAGRKIVSSAHLADGGAPSLSEFEYGLYISDNAFERWIVRCMSGAGYPDFSPLEVMVVHTVNHRARQAAGRHLFRAQCRGYASGQLCAEKAALQLGETIRLHYSRFLDEEIDA